jgi:hypothetical protein
MSPFVRLLQTEGYERPAAERLIAESAAGSSDEALRVTAAKTITAIREVRAFDTPAVADAFYKVLGGGAVL